jgi:hypothetical protein
MNQHLEIDEAFTWKMFILSSGKCLSQKLATQKEQIQGGQEHRAISLNIRPKMPVKTVRPLKTYVIS